MPIAITILGLLVVGRQVVALLENRQLNRRLHATVVRLSEREQELRDALRRELAAAEQVPPYRIFPDTVLIALARARPTTPDGMRQISGVGEVKLRAYGRQFLEAIREHAAANPAPPPQPSPRPAGSSSVAAAARRQTAFALFRERAAVPDVMHQLKLARSTVADYLVQFVETEKPTDISAWVPDEIYQEVAAAAQQVGTEKLKPIYQALGEQVSYDDIRLVLAHLAATGTPS
jgi:ATP-dependent DNA helicase RecQ